MNGEKFLLSASFVKKLGELKRKINEVNATHHEVSNRKKYYILLDVETVGVSDRSCYDISWVVMDRLGEILKVRAFAVREVFNDMQVMNQAYYFNKFPKYLELLSHGIYKIRNLNTIIKQLNKDIQDFNVSIFTAYNSNFDVSSLGYTIERYNATPINYGKAKRECLWEQAVNSLMNTYSYRKFARENNLFTASRKYWSSTAESCYMYMKKNLNLGEEHIGLYDVLFHEAEILKTCNKKHIAKVNTEPSSSTWRKMKITDEEMAIINSNSNNENESAVAL